MKSVAAAVLVLVAVALAAPVALAQQREPEPQAARTRDGAHTAPRADQAEAPDGAAGHQGFENGRGAAMLFWVLALATVGGALFVITRRNLVAAVMGMVGTFFALAALYAMLYAHFLAAIQVLVYAGAIMVLFVFVIMILNRPEDQPWALQGLLGKALAGLAILYLLVRVSGALWAVKDTPHAVVAGPRPQLADSTRPSGDLQTPSKAAQRDDDWGSTRSVGKTLFREYLFPFEAVSLVLLVAVVGGIALSRPHRDPEATPEGNPEGKSGDGEPGEKS
ncbi:MAG TPA: NADH-quinone oxidoreductase subunit J [Kofleriaceae bacterium]|nr:NADH-quinone oxidoreductase subunit J [Kofleriaceae bacterium]